MAGMDTRGDGQVNYRSFVGSLVESAPSHPRMLYSAPPGSAGAGGLAMPGMGPPPLVPEALLLSKHTHSRALSAMGSTLGARGGSDAADTAASAASGSAAWTIPARSRSPTLATASRTTGRTACDDTHDIAVQPFLDSLHRTGRASLPDLPASLGGGGGGGGGFGSGDLAHSVDLGSLARGAGGTAGTGTTGASRTTAPSHATGRYSRFWDKRYADTSSVVSADPGCPSYAALSDTHVRKTAEDPLRDPFHGYQQADRAAAGRRTEQARQRFGASSAMEARYSSQDDACGADDGKIAAIRMTRDW